MFAVVTSTGDGIVRLIGTGVAVIGTLRSVTTVRAVGESRPVATTAAGVSTGPAFSAGTVVTAGVARVSRSVRRSWARSRREGESEGRKRVIIDSPYGRLRANPQFHPRRPGEGAGL